MINRKQVIILERFTHSVLIKYVKSSVESSVNPSVIKSFTPKNIKNKQK